MENGDSAGLAFGLGIPDDVGYLKLDLPGERPIELSLAVPWRRG